MAARYKPINTEYPKSYYITRWRGRDKVWHTYTIEDRPHYRDAKRQFAEAIKYFYTYIEIELVRVTEQVIHKAKGTSE